MIKTLAEHSLEKAIEGMAYQAEFKAYPTSDNISVICFQWISSEPAEKETGFTPYNPDQEENEEEVDDLSQTIDELDDALGKN